MNVLYGLLIGVLLATGSAECAAQNTAHSSAPDATAELEQKAEHANGGDCARLNMQVARLEVDNARRFFDAGDMKAAHNAIEASLHYVGRSVDCSLQAHKREKDTEIDLRHLIERMNDLLHTLDTEQRPQLSRALTELEAQRDKLLHAIFGTAAGSSTSEKKP